MSKNIVFFMIMLVLAGLNLGTIRRAEDPIRDTQTDPILYEQKKEEEKDGKKGALLHSVKYNPADSFLTASPNALPKDEKALISTAPKSGSSGAGWWEEAPGAEGTPDAQRSEAAAGTAESNWWEEAPAAGKESDREDVTLRQEPAPGESPGATQPEAKSAQGDPVPAEGSPSDYWW